MSTSTTSLVTATGAGKAIEALRIERWAIDIFKPDERQLARHDDPEVISLRGLDMLANGQLQPVGATEDGRLIFGHGRYLAATSAGIKHLDVKVFDAFLTPSQIQLIRAAENFQRTDLTAYQKWITGKELMECNPDWKLSDLAEHLHLKPWNVTQLMSPSNCVQAWQEALKEGKVGITDVYSASKFPESEQAAILAFKISGGTRDQINEKRKTRDKPEGPPGVKVGRIVCPLNTQTRVTVNGPAMSLDSYIETLVAALELARRSKREGHDPKTAQAVWVDRAKARGQ